MSAESKRIATETAKAKYPYIDNDCDDAAIRLHNYRMHDMRAAFVAGYEAALSDTIQKETPPAG